MDGLILAHHLPRDGVERAPGPPILFIHGAWHGAWAWENFVPWFTERGHEVYTIDLRGHGHHYRAGQGPGKARIRDYVADLEAAVERIGSPVALVGHSMGGFVIQKYLENHMAPVAVLLAAAPPGGATKATLRSVVGHFGSVPRLVRRLSLAGLLDDPATMRELMFSSETPDSVVSAACRRLNEESFPAFLDMHGFDLPDTRQVLSPVVVLGAEEDGIFSREDVEATARAYGTRALWVSGGHDLMLDVAWREAADLVRRAVVAAIDPGKPRVEPRAPVEAGNDASRDAPRDAGPERSDQAEDAPAAPSEEVEPAASISP